MEDNSQDGSQSQDKPLYDMGNSLSYGQEMDSQYLNTTQPFRIKDLKRKRPRLDRFARLRTPSQFLTPITGLLSSEDGASSEMSISKAALLITGTMILSRFLGLLRSSLFAGVLGTSAITDAYNQASLLPDLIFNIVAGGSLMSAFIPIFNGYLFGKRDEKAAWHLASTALNLATAGMVLLAIIAIFFARQIVLPYNYGVSEAQLNLTVDLTRVMLLQSVIMGMGVIVTAVLNARKRFFLPALGSLLYPLGSIIGLIPGVVLNIVHQRNDTFTIYCATWGVVLGALLMVGIQVPGLAKAGMLYSFAFDWRYPGIRQVVQQMLPRIGNALMLNLSTGVDRVLISFLVVLVGSAGFITQYTLAFSVVLIPLSAVMAVATAAFPTMAAYAAEDRLDYLAAIVLETLRSILFVSIPASIGLMILSLPIIQVLYEHQSFTLSQAQSMAVPLVFFALGLPGLAVVEILTRSFYALRNSRTPVLVSVGQFVCKIVLSLLLLNPVVWLVQMGALSFLHMPLSSALLTGSWGMGALALSTSIAVLLEAVVLLWLLHRRLGGLYLSALVSFVARVLLASLAMALCLFVIHWLLDLVIVVGGGDGKHSLNLLEALLIFMKLLIMVCLGVFVYLRTSRFLRVLGDDNLRPVNRLLARLHLAWI